MGQRLSPCPAAKDLTRYCVALQVHRAPMIELPVAAGVISGVWKDLGGATTLYAGAIRKAFGIPLEEYTVEYYVTAGDRNIT